MLGGLTRMRQRTINRWATRSGHVIRRTLWAALVVLALTLVTSVRHAELFIGHGHVQPDSGLLPTNEKMTGVSPVLWLGGGSPVSFPLEPKTVALTFDDGPSLDWTPEIQRVLDHYGVPGTFFVIGEHVVRAPDVVRDLDAAGHEIGNHSFTHAKLGELPDSKVQLQTQLTDRAIATVIGKRPIVVRPPYSGRTEFFQDDELRAAQAMLKGDDRLLVLSTASPRDFDHDITADQIVRDSMPTNGESVVITLHDAGGNRAQTVQALHRLIPQLQAEGYRFTTASKIARLPFEPATSFTPDETKRVSAFTHSNRIVNVLLDILLAATVIAAAVSALRFMLLAFVVRRGRATTLDLREYLEPVSVVIPAYNEEVGIEAAVRSIAASDYPDLRVIVVDDGSTDRTAEIVAGLGVENVTLVRQVNQGKASALNTGVAACDTEVIVMVDGDTIFESDTVREIVKPFVDVGVGAVAGNAKVGNRGRFLTSMQHVEYALASEIERRFFSSLGVSACVPGAIGAFRRTALRDAGGLSADTIAEDSDITVAIARKGWRIDYRPAARAWTEVPSTLRALLKQRRRWSYGVLQVIAKHRRAMVERGLGGRLARVIFPYQLITGYLLPAAAPAVDLLVLYQLAFDRESWRRTLTLWLVLNAISTATNVYALWLGRERTGPGWWAAAGQQLFYRQLLYVAAIRALKTAVTGERMAWHTARRFGGLITTETEPMSHAPT